ncbi:hypothetical protein J437_LFUL008752 [Ladona fulva]|uniref:Calpain catalytic domain-containing protein n=1 Tax=Ladona fulva TaxID=123851 RepID=A0A8K0K648_LADFU|nr:hypothetical protein J437_LFUL008752 [Ladona fulva]
MFSRNHISFFSQFMRWIISSIGILKTIADENDFTVEGEHSQYDANLEGKWRPWYHIYSFCKAGKVPHTPIINPVGKYVIRLYYLGCWRKFLIDDLLPVDYHGRIMLPVSSNKGELWPMLLCKGLLKIASNFWNKRDDLSGFQPISCLTGWVCEEITNM